MLRSLFRWWQAAVGRSRLQREIAEELAFHVDSRAADLERAGLTPESARRQARLELGAVERWKEECRQALGQRLLDELRDDVRLALRLFRRSPVFAAVGILSLALGIGANTLVFSVVNGLLLRPLPVADPDRVFFVQPSGPYPGHSFPAYRELLARNTTFDGLVGYRIAPMSMDIGGRAERIWGYLATGNYFDVLGVRPALGRFFTEEEDRHPGASPYLVLSHGFWRTRFGADPRVVGSTLHINRVAFTVLGVGPPGFHGLEVSYRPAVWVPMMMQPIIETGNPWLEARRTYNLWVAGRLRPGVTPVAAAANLDAIADALAGEHPDSDPMRSMTLARPGLIGDMMRGPVRAFTAGLLLLAGLVLVVTCANLAGLLTARGSDRQREFAVRLSLGASRARLARQLLTEAALLACLGGLAGAWLAHVGMRALAGLRLPVDMPFVLDVHPDGRVLLFACLITTVAALLSGASPARQALAMDPNAAIKRGADAGGLRQRVALRDGLVLVQVMLSFVLVAGCFLALRGLEAALDVPLGMRPAGVTTLGFDLGLAGYDRSRGEVLQRRALEATERLAGITVVASANTVPLSLDQSYTSVFTEDALSNGEAASAVYYHVSPGFFRAVGTRLVAGRDFDERDGPGAPRVAIVNQTFARQILRTSEPIGQSFRHGRDGPRVEVIGVVEDGRYVSLTEGPRPAIFRHVAQYWSANTLLLARSERPASQVLAEMRAIVAKLDPHLPTYAGSGLDELVGTAFLPNRVAAIALSAFGALALLLAGAGVHGLVAYAVARRQREIGIRVAIGASRPAILRLVLGRVLSLLLAGVTAGTVLTLALAPLLSAIVYQTRPRDPSSLALVAATLVVMGIMACWVPVRRALRVDPSAALRAE